MRHVRIDEAGSFELKAAFCVEEFYNPRHVFSAFYVRFEMRRSSQ
jgi:hypothetical protein